MNQDEWVKLEELHQVHTQRKTKESQIDWVNTLECIEGFTETRKRRITAKTLTVVREKNGLQSCIEHDFKWGQVGKYPNGWDKTLGESHFG